MKVLLICSSPHKEKGRTFSLAKEVLKGLGQEKVDYEVIHLDNFRIFFCKHCEECHKIILHCAIKDDAGLILKKMLEAEGIILATPNYINQVTALMKALFDRSAHFIHCKRLLGKYIAGVVSSGSGQNKEVLDYIKFYAHTCGAQYSGGVSCGMQLAQEETEQAAKLARTFVADIKEKKEYSGQIELIEKGRQHFRQIIKMRKNEWEDEYKYWLGQGWL